MKAIKEIFPLLSTPRKVVITTHQKPDADAMGSSLALSHFLTGFGHSVTVISPTNWAGWVDWMPGTFNGDTVCVPANSCVIFNMYDSYGDGMGG